MVTDPKKSSTEYATAEKPGTGGGPRSGPRPSRFSVGPSLSNYNICPKGEDGGILTHAAIAAEMALPEDGELNKLTGGQARSAYAFGVNVQALVETFGIERCLFLTVTFAHEKERQNWPLAQERWRRFQTGDTRKDGTVRRPGLKHLFPEGIAIGERNGKNHHWHFHAIVVTTAKDVRTGADVDALARGDFRTAPAQLKAVWAQLRAIAEDWGIGMCHSLPIRTNAEAVGRYAAKYISKHIEARRAEDKGARLLRYWGERVKEEGQRGPGRLKHRKAWSRLSWVSLGSTSFRQATAKAAQVLGEDPATVLGPQWGWKLREPLSWWAFVVSARGVTPEDEIQFEHEVISVMRRARRLDG